MTENNQRQRYLGSPSAYPQPDSESGKEAGLPRQCLTLVHPTQTDLSVKKKNQLLHKEVRKAREISLNLEKQPRAMHPNISVQRVDSLNEIMDEMKRNYSTFSFHPVYKINIKIPGKIFLLNSCQAMHPIKGLRRITTETEEQVLGNRIKKTDFVGFIVPL